MTFSSLGTAPDLDLSVIFPVCNEKENLVALLQALHSALNPLNLKYELIAVDDGSTDGSTALLKELASQNKELRVIVFRRNAGQSAAFDAGFREARGSRVVTLDADLQNDPHDIPKLLKLLDEGYDFVTGWRKDRQDGFFLRTFPSKLANFLIRKITKTKVHDLGCSLKAYRYDIVKDLRLYGEMHRFISVLAENLGARVGEVVVSHRSRNQGRSKYGLSRTFKVLLDLITVWFMKSYQTKPIYVFGGIGGGMLSMSFLISLFVLYEKFFRDTWVHKNPLFLVSVMLAVIGVQFLGMGLIAEIVIRTYFESQHKPAYFIAEKHGFRS